jgi:hypothetical protein
LWQGVWADPDMPDREEISHSCETNDGDAGTATRQLDVILGYDNIELSAEHNTPVASHVADDKRSKVLQIITKRTEHHDIIPDGSLLPSDLYDDKMPNGCAPMTKMLMQLLVTKGKHSFAGMLGLDLSIRKDLTELLHKYRLYRGADAPPDDHLQRLTLREVCEMNVTRWLVLNLKGDGEQKWDYVNAHLITMNVPYYVEHNQIQWLDGSNVRPNFMCPNIFPWRHSLKDRKWEKVGHSSYAAQDTPEKIEEAVVALSFWTDQLWKLGFIDQRPSPENMYDVCTDDGAWTMSRIKRFHESWTGNFVLFKHQWNATQYVKDVSDRVDVTEIFHGTSPQAVVPIALAHGLSALREDAGNHVESHIAEAATYFAPGPMKASSLARGYASPSRFFKDDCSPMEAFAKVDELSASNAACVRVYFKCSGLGPKIKNKSAGQKNNTEICFGPGNSRIDELWITVGEPQDTANAVSYFTVPERMMCCETAEAVDAMSPYGKPHTMFENDSLNVIHQEPFKRWTAKTWNTTHHSPPIQY